MLNQGLIFRSEIMFSQEKRNLFQKLREECIKDKLEPFDFLWDSETEEASMYHVLGHFNIIKGLYFLKGDLELDRVNHFYAKVLDKFQVVKNSCIKVEEIGYKALDMNFKLV